MVGAMLVALAFVVGAGAALTLPESMRRGLWLPLHLALAGGAATAIAGVMPFFVAAFAAAPSPPVRVRAAAVIAVAAGAVLVAIAGVAGEPTIALIGGTAYIGGLVATGTTVIALTHGALGPSRGIVTRGYLAAIVMVIAGAGLGTLALAGDPVVVGAWDRLRVAHAWLNLFGFVSLTIATTLIHFVPTVAGTRIVESRPARATIAGLATGPPILAAGVLTAARWLAALGAVVTLAAGIALVWYVAAVWRRRGSWTTDLAWHRFALAGLVSAVAWFAIGVAIAAGRVLLLGADPAAWSLELVLAPLVAGWVVLALLASVTHLIPSVGPGDQAVHARQRRVLGRAALVRLGGADVAIAAIAIGLPLRVEALVVVGLGVLALTIGWTLALVATAVAAGLRRAG